MAEQRGQRGSLGSAAEASQPCVACTQVRSVGNRWYYLLIYLGMLAHSHSLLRGERGKTGGEGSLG